MLHPVFEAAIHLVQQVLQRQLAKLTIRHQLAKDLFVAFHAVYDQALECLFEYVSEVIFRVGFSRLLQHLALDGFLLYLVKKQLICLGEIRAKTLIQQVDQLGQPNRYILLPGAHIAGAFEWLGLPC